MVHYQILLGATGFLLALGIVMVASASSVFLINKTTVTLGHLQLDN